MSKTQYRGNELLLSPAHIAGMLEQRVIEQIAEGLWRVTEKAAGELPVPGYRIRSTIEGLP